MMNIREYVVCTDADSRRDFEEHIFENVYDAFWCSLPKFTDTDDMRRHHPIWADDNSGEIICANGELANLVADILDNISGERGAITGYYDPDEDERNGTVDNYTGWWYVRFD